MPFFTSGASRLHFQREGAGPTVVLLHGVGGNHASWFQQVPQFARRHDVIALDQRGFGLSEDREGAGRSAMAGDLRALLDHLSIDSAALVAQSMGGGTAVDFACTHPRRVARVVLAGTALGLKLPDEAEALATAARSAAQALPQAERVLGRDFRTTNPDLTWLYARIAGFNTHTSATVPGRYATHPVENLAATGIPILMIAGEHDPLFPPAVLRAVAARLPAARLIEIPRTGHSAYFERPEIFTAFVLDFFAAGGW